MAGNISKERMHAINEATADVIEQKAKEILKTKVDTETFVDETSKMKETDAELQAAIDNKADKQTVDGGFKGGHYASSGGGAAVGNIAEANDGGSVGNGAITNDGGSVGKQAEANDGGSVGNGAITNDGGSVGKQAEANDGGSVGNGAITVNGGSVGNEATSNNGGSVGVLATSNDGGAVGNTAIAGDGFSGGKEAKTVDSSGTAIDAIQLGTGTNTNSKTLQIYDHQLMDADGNIPIERMTKEVEAREAKDTELQESINNLINNKVSINTVNTRHLDDCTDTSVMYKVVEATTGGENTDVVEGFMFVSDDATDFDGLLMPIGRIRQTLISVDGISFRTWDVNDDTWTEWQSYVAKTDLELEISNIDQKFVEFENYTFGDFALNVMSLINDEVQARETADNELSAQIGDINTNQSEETCTLSEALPLTVVSSDGWTGDLTIGFTHISDNTNNLVLSLGEDTGNNIYQVTFNSSVDATNTNIFVTIGGSEPFLLYGMPQPYSVGIKSVSNGNLEFVPESTFTGAISNITVKKVISTGQVNDRLKITDSKNSTVFEARFSNADRTDTSIPYANIFLGLKTGETNTSGYGNVGIGYNALKNNTSGFWNTGIGMQALLNNTVGSRNIGIGYGALQNNICGTRNIAIGTFSMLNNTTGGWNISIGADNMNNNTSGKSNVSIGFQAMYHSTSSENNVAVGVESLKSITTGTYNTAVGHSSGYGIKTGSNNMAVGKGSLQNCDNGSYNTAVGMNALYGLKNGNYNIAIGVLAGRGTSGTAFKENIFIGSSTGQKIGNNANRNIIIGHASGNTLTTGVYNIIIGATCEVPNATGNYQLNIGNLITGNMATGSKSVTIDGTMTINNLPTSDPNVSGQLWNDNGTVKVSVGA